MTIHRLIEACDHKNVTLDDVLAAKEDRHKRQKEMLKKYNSPIISITINMPGPVKDLPVTRQLLDYAVNELKKVLTIYQIGQLYLPTGPEALLAVAGQAQDIKEAAVAVEEAEPFGRLLDVDVFAADGSLISRRQQGQSRGCLVCGQEAVTCMRENKHTAAEVGSAVCLLLTTFKAYLTRNICQTAQKIGCLAIESMLYEAACTPAPGLVDRINSGAHTDMDFFSFMSSTAALSTAMARTAQAGISHDDLLPELLPVLRHIGIEAEREMLQATKGVNTQKGLLFSLGIAAAAAGLLCKQDKPLKAADVLAVIAEITTGIVERELGRAVGRKDGALTAGERLYRDYKITGIRGEMEAGLPAVGAIALPTLRTALEAGLTINAALVDTLLVLMLNADDTTVMHRHDPDKMRCWVRAKVEAVISAGGMATEQGRKMTELLDQEFIAHNVSPGGAADLLAVTWFLYRLETEF
ncbi:2-(5''-triphosphoribosyl)-3'-dephosphocoenzyme-A synthase [bioreactor metagenome]|uniref:2-(5''-triphosphoribosyl)-3'-dephosphocoenzyme-A synthase n=1 Tax=bioreactor metagenome TaxID=1076179 RepID=A0A644SVB6_9ZZZZ|nr:triphosphoribosyl-dephospho-CoA synthase CitG [Negativicutes bacterium]